MIKLTIGNSESKVEGLSEEQMRSLRDIMSYKLDNHFSGGHCTTKYLISKRGDFSTGVLHIVEKFLSYGDYETHDSRKLLEGHKATFNLSLDLTPYEEQEEAAMTCQTLMRGVVRACTGFGKSLTMALVVNKLQVKTLIVVPNLGLKRQLTDSFTKWFGNLDNITIENVDSTNLMDCTEYGCVIIDEAHHAAAKTYTLLNKYAWNKIYYRFSFTATPFRSRDEENMLLESITGQQIYEVSYKTAVDKGYICPIEAFYVDVEPEDQEFFGNYSSVYKKGIVQSQKYNELVINLLNKLSKSGKSLLTVVKEIEHGKTLSDATGIDFANGQDTGSDTLIKCFANKVLDNLIGTHGIVGEGVDTRACEYVIIPIPVKSKNLLMQIIGRAVRRYEGKDTAKIILVNNKTHDWFKKAFKEQCKVLKEEYGIKPVKLEI